MMSISLKSMCKLLPKPKLKAKLNEKILKRKGKMEQNKKVSIVEGGKLSKAVQRFSVFTR